MALAAAVVVVGAVARFALYLQNPSVWHDEAFLLLNILGKDFGELAGALEFCQAAPPMFLWIERAVAIAVDDGTLALRFVPMLAGILAILLIVWTAHNELRPTFGPWAVLATAVLAAGSERLLWHGCEVKQYSSDCLAAALVLAAYSLSRPWSILARCSLLGGMCPILLSLSYPAVFALAAVLLGMAPTVMRRRRTGEVVALGLFAAALLTSFLFVYLGPIRAQRSESLEQFWMSQYADWSRPWTIPPWLVRSTIGIADYCLRPVGGLYLLFAAFGAAAMAKQQRGDVAFACAGPILLAALAGMFQAHPYDGSRLFMFALPGFALLTAAGACVAIGRLWARSRGAAAIAALLMVLPLELTIRRTFDPWLRADCASAAEFVLQHQRSGDAVVGDSREFDYYLRTLGACYRFHDRLPRSLTGPTWIVAKLDDSEEQARIEAALVERGMTALESARFAKSLVYLVVRKAEEAAPKAGSRL